MDIFKYFLIISLLFTSLTGEIFKPRIKSDALKKLVHKIDQSSIENNLKTIRSFGPRSGLYALVAASLGGKEIASLKAKGALGSLKEILSRNWGANRYPELFCFGLLKHFDVRQLVALAEPSKISLLP